jgi:hypothetical protein
MEDIQIAIVETKQSTSKKAAEILIEKNEGYIEPNKDERLNLLIAFAKKNKVVYGKAFDIVKIIGEEINLMNLEEVEKNLDRITIYEIKSTSRKNIDANFNRYFFGLTTAELLVAQNLKRHFKFIFVNISTKEILELDLNEIYKKAKGIYPCWSIQF